MTAGNRVEIIDIFRGMAVMGFIVWHAFDLFYSGNRYEVPVFRAMILTRVTFVATSAMVLGLKVWNNYKVSHHLKRSCKIMMYPVVIGIIKAITLRTLDPIAEILLYPFHGNGDFTFSILIAIGCIYLALPFLLKHKEIKHILQFIAIVLVCTELLDVIILPEFWRFLCISIVFADVVKYIIRFDVRRYNIFGALLLCLNVSLFYLLIFNEDIYWIIRNDTLPQMLLLFTALFGIALNLIFIDKIRFFKKYLLVFGNNSFLIYIGHYVIYVFIGIFTGFHNSMGFGVGIIIVATISFFVVLNRFYENEMSLIKRIFF